MSHKIKLSDREAATIGLALMALGKNSQALYNDFTEEATKKYKETFYVTAGGADDLFDDKNKAKMLLFCLINDCESILNKLAGAQKEILDKIPERLKN